MARTKELSSETRQSILTLRNAGHSMRAIAKKLKISYNGVHYSLQRTAQTGSSQNKERSGRPRCTTEQEDEYLRVSCLSNRRLTGPQLAASLNSSRKTPVSASTVKRRLQDAGLRGRTAKTKTVPHSGHFEIRSEAEVGVSTEVTSDNNGLDTAACLGASPDSKVVDWDGLLQGLLGIKCPDMDHLVERRLLSAEPDGAFAIKTRDDMV